MKLSGWALRQYSLRTTLVLVLMVALYASHLVRREADRRVLIKEIEAAGGKVTVDETKFSFFPKTNVTAVSLPNDRLQQVHASRLLAFPKLKSLTLTNVDMQLIRSRGSLRSTVQATQIRFQAVSKDLLERLDRSVQ
ncbi:MAG: hypothetical protein U0930_26500 [Pirellulales bacterium]